ncbi:MAG: L-histidine N(alpha)-methyltransferase [Gemmatimonadales bacterium]
MGELLEFARAVATGLSDTPRWLPCRYLYDARGSELFEQICQQPEYYLTRTEASILHRCAAEIRSITGPVTLIELGSGSSEKTSHLLAAYTGSPGMVRYVPVDVSDSALRIAIERIDRDHPDVEVSGLVGTYGLAFPRFKDYSPSMVVFLGSTIGNLNRDESVDFWTRVSDNMAEGDFFLLGIDLVKDPTTLEAAYNDAAEVTTEFTKNIFRRINRELGAHVDLDQLQHVAVYNAEWQRIEISIRFLASQEVYIAPVDRSVTVGAGELVMTEISRKFVVGKMKEYLSHFGLETRRVFTDKHEMFALLLLQREVA